MPTTDHSRDHRLDTPDGPMGLYEALPGEGVTARGAVVVLQEAFGVNDHIRDVTRRFADAGFHAVAPELFHRSGGGTVDYGNFDQVRPHFAAMTDDGILGDIDATLAHLRAAGWTDGSIGVVGFCMGGRASFLVATARALGAAVGFYGGGIVRSRFNQFPPLIGRAGELATPWLGLFGDEDRGIPAEDVEALREALAGAPMEAEIVRYPGAPHGFHCDRRADYRAEAAADGWARTLAWFHQNLAG